MKDLSDLDHNHEIVKNYTSSQKASTEPEFNGICTGGQ
jgi:hypothetical protein